MDNPFQTNDDVSAPKPGEHAAVDVAPESLKAMALQALAEQQRSSRPDATVGSQFAESFSFELNRSVEGAAQIVGAEKFVPVLSEPEESHDAVGQHVQMAGRAVGGLLPMLGMAALSRFGVGKLLGHEAATAENLALKRTAMGLNLVESAGTGFLVGALLTPSDASAQESLTSLVGDRIRSGATSAAAFSVMTGSSHGWNRLASSELASTLRIGGAMKASVVNGIVSGIPGGIANVEFDSLARSGKLNYDREQLGKSVYEMSLFGGTFGLGSRLVEKRSENQSLLGGDRIQFKHAPSEDSLRIYWPKGVGKAFGDEYSPFAYQKMMTNLPGDLRDSNWFVPDSSSSRHLGYSDDVAELIEYGKLPIKTPGGQFITAKVSKSESFELLSKTFGADSPTMQGLRELDKKDSLGSNDIVRLTQFVSKDSAARMPLVEQELARALAEGSKPKYNHIGVLATDRLEGLEKLQQNFGADSPVLNKILRLEDGNFLQLHSLGDFISKDPGKRVPFVEKTVNAAGADARDLASYRLGWMQSLTEHFGEESPVVARVNELDRQSSLFELSTVLKFIDQDPATNKAIVSKLVEQGADGTQLDGRRLAAFKDLNKEFGSDSTVMTNLLLTEKDADFGLHVLSDAARIIKENPERGKALVEKYAVKGASRYAIEFETLKAIDALSHRFGLDQPSIDKLIKADGEYSSQLPSVIRFLEKNPEQNVYQLKSALQGGSTDGKMSISRLLSVAEDYALFAKMTHITPYLDSVGAHRYNVMSFVKQGGEHNLKVLDLLVRAGADRDQFDTRNLQWMQQIVNAGEKFHSGLVARLPDVMHSGGFQPSEVASYLESSRYYVSDPEGGQPARVRKLLSAIDAGATGAQLTTNNLNSVDLIGRDVPLDHTDLRKLFDLEREGLSLGTISSETSRAPETFTPLVRELLSKESDQSEADRANPYVRLTKLIRSQSSDDGLTAKALNSILTDRTNTRMTEKVADFIAENPAKRVPLIADSLKSSGLIYATRLQGLESLKDQFGDKPEVLNHLLKVESDYSDFSLHDLSEFVKKNPDVYKPLVESVVRNGGTHDHLDPYRLGGLKVIVDTFGENSNTAQYLLKLEEESRFSFGDLGEFLKKHPDQAKAVEQLAERKVTIEELDPERLEAVADLEKAFGKESLRMQRILASEPHGLVTELAYFLKDKSDSGAPDLNVAERQRLVEREIDRTISASDAAVTGYAVRTERLTALLSLESTLGEQSDAMNSLRSFEDHGKVSLFEFSLFMDADKAKVPFVVKLLKAMESDPSQDYLDRMDLSGLSNFYGLDNFMHLNSKSLEQLIKLEWKGVYMHNLLEFIQQNPEQHASLVRRELDADANLWTFDTQRLASVAGLENVLGRDSLAMKEILVHEPFLNLSSLNQILREHPERIRPLIVEAAEQGGAKLLDPDRLVALSHFNMIFEEHPELLSKIRHLESEGLDFSAVSKFMNTPSKEEFVQTMLENNAPASHFENSNLKLRYLFESKLNGNSPEEFGGNNTFDRKSFDKVLTFAESNNAGSGILAYLEADPTQFGDRISAVSRLIETGAPANIFVSHVLSSFVSLEHSMGEPGPELTKKLLSLVQQGLDIHDLASLVSHDETSKDMVRSLLAKDAPASEFSRSALLDRRELDTITSRFEGDDALRIRALRDSGLSASRLKNFIDENPESRVDMVKTLLKEKADVARFNQQMSLSVLPDRVAYALVNAAAHGGMSIPEVLNHLKDWRTGRQFRQLIMDRVESGATLTATDMQAVVAQAKVEPKPQAKESNQDSASKPAGTSDSLVDILNDSAKSILAGVPKDQNIVVLGRDMAAVLPSLRAARPNVQYFLWSSIQDRKTAGKQWLKEVPPGSAVIDTGYSGSIINQIREFDPSVSGFLLSTDAGKYPRLMQNSSHRNRVEKIEAMPKYIGRSTNYTELGNAVSRSNKRESNDVQKNKVTATQHDRWDYERQSRERFEAMGLPEWDAWRYSQFTGLTPRERLGLTNDGEVQAHYRRVEHERKLLQSDGSAKESP